MSSGLMDESWARMRSIAVVMGDITDMEVDAIVNAANTDSYSAAVSRAR